MSVIRAGIAPLVSLALVCCGFGYAAGTADARLRQRRLLRRP